VVDHDLIAIDALPEETAVAAVTLAELAALTELVAGISAKRSLPRGSTHIPHISERIFA
jgi:hypothetical protein